MFSTPTDISLWGEGDLGLHDVGVVANCQRLGGCAVAFLWGDEISRCMWSSIVDRVNHKRTLDR